MESAMLNANLWGKSVPRVEFAQIVSRIGVGVVIVAGGLSMLFTHPFPGAAAAQRGEPAITPPRYQVQAERFAHAKDVSEERADILDREAEALYHRSDEHADNAALSAAIERYRILLTLRPRDRVPLDWARTQTGLGNALTRLGARDRETALLEQAVAAFGAALEEGTRDRGASEILFPPAASPL
jgi:tetratricopeptide (TPR) repeat protein